MITYHDIEQGTPEWKELRADRYTGSNADKLLQYAGRTRLTDGEITPYAIAEITGFKGNFYTRRGHLLEDQAIALYQKITGETGIRIDDNRRVGFVTNEKYPHCGYSPDDIYPDKTIEVKAFEVKKHLAMIEGDIPLKVLAQCYFGMLICDKKLCDLLLYNPTFAKKEIDGKHNPYYHPRKALVIHTIQWKSSIAKNFDRILAPLGAVA